MHHKGGFTAVIDFACFGTAIVGVKDKRPVLDVFQQNHPRIWHTVFVHSRQRDGVRIIGFGAFSLS